MLFNGQLLFQTETAEDVFEVDRFSDGGSALIQDWSTMEIRLYDSDVDANDLITGCQLAPISASYLRSRLLRCGEVGGSQFYLLLSM